MTLTPAYGRDYKTGKEAKEAFLGGKDWLTPFFQGEQLINMEQLPPGSSHVLRFGGSRKTIAVKVTKDVHVSWPQPEVR